MPVPSQSFRAGATAGVLLAVMMLASAGLTRADEPARSSIGNATGFDITGVTPAVVRPGETRTVQVTGHGLTGGVDMVLVAGGPYLESVTPVPESTVDVASDLVIVNGRAYLHGKESFHIFDISDPARPVQLGWLDDSYLPAPFHIAVADDRAYVARGRLGTIDLSDPAAPRNIGLSDSDAPCGARFVAVSGQTAFVSYNPWQSRVCAYDISGDGAPVFLTTVEPFESDWETAGPLQTSGHILYVADPQRGLVALDVTDPLTPKILSMAGEPVLGLSGLLSPDLLDMSVDCGYAYVNGWANNLLVYDIRNPLAISQVTQHVVRTRRPGAVAARGGLVLATSYTSSTPWLADVTDPTTPFFDYWIPSWDWGFVYNFSLAVSGRHALAPGPFSLRSFNLEHVTRQDVLSRVLDTNGAVMAGDLMAVSDLTDRSLLTYDLSDPRQPVALGQVDLPEGVTARPLAITGDDLLAVSPGHPQTGHLLDLASPEEPAYVGVIDTSGSVIANECGSWWTSYIEIISEYGLAAGDLVVRWTRTENEAPDACRGVVEIMRNDDPLRPVSAALLPGSYDAANVGARLEQDRLTLVQCQGWTDYGRRCTDPMLTIWDVSSPTEPSLLASVDPGGEVVSFDVDGNLTYVLIRVGGQKSLRVLDTSQPGSPVMRGSLTRGLLDATHVSGQDGLVHIQFGYESDFDYGQGFYQTLLIDARDPDTPRLAGGASAIQGARAGEINLLDCDSDTCLYSLLPTTTDGEAMDDATYRIDLPAAIRPGPYHVVAFGEDGQVAVLPNAVVVAGDGEPPPPAVCHEDRDLDGFYDPFDCDDDDDAVNPGAGELPGNAIDEDCDGEIVCDPREPWPDRQSLLTCVARACGELVSSGRLSGRECAQAVRATARD